MLEVQRQTEVAADVATVWACLTEPDRFRQWFADVDRLAPGEPFRFDFGDGDFFAGRMGEWLPGRSWRLQWRFMGLGPRYDIELGLEADGDAGGTRVRVRDRGALTAETAAGLDEGWQDFLSRLVRHAEGGGNVRYRWTPEIALGLFAGGEDGDLPAPWRDPSWWRQAFPTARVRLDTGDPRRLVAELDDPAWGGLATRVQLQVEATPRGPHALVLHDGWSNLPEDLQVAERRRYAGAWARALAPLEERKELVHA